MLTLKGVIEFLKEQPFAYLDEMVAFIYDEYNVQVHETTVWRALKRAKISRKKVLYPFSAQIACGLILATNGSQGAKQTASGGVDDPPD